MSLISLSLDLNRIATALENIADCLDKLLPPVYPQKGVPEPAQPYKIETASNEETYAHELEDQLVWYKDHAEILLKQVGEELDAEGRD